VSSSPGHRGTIFLEDAVVVVQRSFAGQQYVLRLLAPRCAAAATPGSFIHLTCGPGLPMRRPLSILRADARAGWIEVLYKVVGRGLAELALRTPGESLSCLGPIGRGFTIHAERPRLLLIGGGVGIPPIVFQAEWLAMQTDRRWKPVVMMGSELPFPFEAGQSQIEVSGLSREVTAAMPLMERLGIPSRLASLSGFAGCYRGYVTALAEAWLGSLTAAQRDETAIMCCGPHPMLVAAAALARRYDLPCQASLEENMACAVGGCAGCTVLVELPEGPAMKRVCVDGPVFDAATVVTLQ
jgi:dihydroorotate dehydrogenase electron transfer subunit